MPPFNNDVKKLKCSFCGKDIDHVHKLIAGPGIFICDECVKICYQIIQEEPEPEPDEKHDKFMSELANTMNDLEALNDLGDVIDKALDQMPAQNSQQLKPEV